MTRDEIPPELQSVWDKLNANLSAIYRDYLYEREHGRPAEVTFHEPVAVDGKLHVAMRYTGDLAEIEALGFEARSWSAGEGRASGIIDLGDLVRLTAHPGVLRLSFGTLFAPALDQSVVDISAREKVWSQTNGVFSGNTGKKVFIGILDTGIDYLHPFFQDALAPLPVTTRIRCIWDQTFDRNKESPNPSLLAAPGETNLDTYGIEYRKDQIDAVLQGRKDPSSIRHYDTSGHGTHVASIAAGDGRFDYKYIGVAPQAELIVVNCMSPRPSTLPVKEPETRFRQAVNYILNVAKLLGQPVVLNASFSNNMSAHDGLSGNEAFLDQIFGDPNAKGCAFVGATGNDAGVIWVGRGPGRPSNQHARIDFRAGEEVIIPIDLFDGRTVQPPGAFPPREALIYVYYPLGAILDLRVDIPYDGLGAIFDFSRDGGSFRGRRYYFARGPHGVSATTPGGRCNLFRFMITPNRDGDHLLGSYVVHMTMNADVRAHLYCSKGALGHFAINTDLPLQPNVHVEDFFQVGSPGGAKHVITVAAYNAEVDGKPVAHYSSRGPLIEWGGSGTAPEKPDLAAPGSAIDAARGQDSPRLLYPAGPVRALQGTSMAAPHVAGTVALMLSQNGSLTPQAIKQALIDGIRPDPTTSKLAIGAGRLNAFEAVKKAT